MKRILWTVAICLLAFAPAIGQQKEPPTTTIKRRTELVLVPAVVTHDGKPVRGLTAKDFNLLHNGRPEKVEVFEAIDATPARVEPVSLPLRTVQNYATADSRQDVVILLFDYLNSSWSTRARIYSFVGAMARQFAGTHTPVSVFLLSQLGLFQLHSFTSDLGNLTKEIERWHSGLPAAAETIAIWSSPAAPTINAQTAAALHQLDVPYESMKLTPEEMAEMTLDAIQQISEAYRGIAGRKKLIWMSTGFPGPTLDSYSQVNSARLVSDFKVADKLERAWKSLSDTNIMVFPIDSNGVVNPSWEGRFSPQNSGAEELMRPVSVEAPSNTPSLIAVAEKTGGRNCTDIPTKCVEQALADGTHYYILGFYLHGENRPGWHKLKINVKQSDSVVRSRNGFVVAEAASKIATTAKEEVDTALASPLDYTSVPLQLSWSILSALGKQTQVEFVLVSPPGGIAVSPDDSRINLYYLAFVRPVGKTEGRTFPVTLTTWISPDQQKILAASGFRFRKQVALAPGRYEVRVLLRDNLARKMGTVSTIIDLSAPPSGESKP